MLRFQTIPPDVDQLRTSLLAIQFWERNPDQKFVDCIEDLSNELMDCNMHHLSPPPHPTRVIRHVAVTLCDNGC